MSSVLEDKFSFHITIFAKKKGGLRGFRILFLVWNVTISNTGVRKDVKNIVKRSQNAASFLKDFRYTAGLGLICCLKVVMDIC